MKKNILFFFFLVLMPYAQAQDKKLLDLPSTTLSFEELVSFLEGEGYQLSYGNVSTDKSITFSKKRLPLEVILEQCCERLELGYRLRGKKIIFFPQKRIKRVTISGYVYDQSSGESLIGVVLQDLTSGGGTTTNLYGFFSYTAVAGTQMRLSYLGFQDSILVMKQDAELSIRLSSTPYQMGEVNIVAKRLQETQMSIATLTPKEIEALPAFMGEPDVIKAMTLLPGISAANDFSGGFYVRGGGPDQNLILIDGANIYNSTHAFDLFSTFNADAIKQVDLIKGGFPARYGGRLSSVMDVRLREGNTEQLTGEVGLGYLLTSGTVEGPLMKGKGSFLLTGRRSFLDLFSEPIRWISSSDTSEVKQVIVFYDFSGKVNFQLSEKDRVFVSFYRSRDRFRFADKDTENPAAGERHVEENDIDLGWANRVWSGRWNHQFSKKLFLNTTLTSSIFELKTDIESKQEGIRDEQNFFNQSTTTFSSNIRDYGLHTQFDYYPHPKHSIKFGSSSTYYNIEPGASNIEHSNSGGTQNLDTALGNGAIRSFESFVFAEDEMTLHPRLKLNLGVNVAMLHVENETYPSVQPRTSLSYSLTEHWSLKGSYAEMSQFIHLLTNSALGIPLDLWVPATPDAPPMRSRQLAMGLHWTAPNQCYFVSVESYYKRMRNLIAYQEGVVFTDARVPWQEKIVTDGEGEAYGAEFFVRKNTGRLTGWVGYTWSWTERQFDDLNRGNPYPYKYDRRHDASVVGLYELNEKVSLSASWVYATGNSITFPRGRYPALEGSGNLGDYVNDNEAPDYEGRNAVKMPSYHRLDLGINFRKEKKRGIRTWNFSVYNTYFRKNPFFVFVEDANTTNSVAPGARPQPDWVLRQTSAFWIVPSVTYNFKFN